MRAYKNIRFTEGPDVADIRNEGRKSSVGRIRRGNVASRWVDNVVSHADGTPGCRIVKVVRNDRGYLKPTAKASVRRYLKRVDRARSLRFEME